MGDDDRYRNEKVFKNISDKFSLSLDYIYGDTIFTKEGKNVRFIDHMTLIQSLSILVIFHLILHFF